MTMEIASQNFPVFFNLEEIHPPIMMTSRIVNRVKTNISCQEPNQLVLRKILIDYFSSRPFCFADQINRRKS